MRRPSRHNEVKTDENFPFLSISVFAFEPFSIMKMRLLILIPLFIAVLSSAHAKKPAPPPKDAYVVLLHGLARTYRSMKKMKKYFEKKGYEVINLRYPSRKKSINHLSQEWFPEALNKNLKKKNFTVHFITHSLGGIIVRSYLQDQKIPNLGRIVMLSPPNQGCELAQKLRDNTFYQHLMGPAGQELGTGEESIPLSLKPIGAEVGVIAGCNSNNLLFSLMISGPDDGKVSVEETKLEEMKDFLVLPLDHAFIMRNPVVMEQSSIFLETGKFKALN